MDAAVPGVERGDWAGRVVEVAPLAGEDEADERVLLGVPVVGTLLPDASGDAGRDELPSAVGADPVAGAVLDDAATGSC